MNGNERILAALRRQQPDRIPTFEWFIDAAVGQALTGSKALFDIVERLDIDGINIRADYAKRFDDDVHFTDEWGIKKKLTSDALPGVMGSPIPDILEQQNYRFPDPAAPGRFATVEAALKRFGGDKAIVLNLRDGFSDMRDLLGYEQALMSMILEPQAFADLLDRVVDYNVELARIASERYGLKIVATTDDIANRGGLLFSPESYMELMAPRFKRVIQGYKSLGYLCVKHCDGLIDDVIDFWVECGIDCIDPVDPDAGYRMADFKQKYGNRICLKGNIDCKELLSNGPTAEVEQAVKDCIRDAGRNGGLILSSSNTIHSGVKPENYRAMLNALHAYGTYPLPE